MLIVALPKCGLCLAAWLALAVGARAQLCGETAGMTPGESAAIAFALLTGIGLLATWLCPARACGRVDA